jgi:hypothetical protein
VPGALARKVRQAADSQAGAALVTIVRADVSPGRTYGESRRWSGRAAAGGCKALCAVAPRSLTREIRRNTRPCNTLRMR